MATTYVDPVFGEVPAPATTDALPPAQTTTFEDPVFGIVESPAPKRVRGGESAAIQDPVFGKVAAIPEPPQLKDSTFGEDIADYVRSAIAGGVESAGMALRGSADIYDTLTNVTRRAVNAAAPEKVKELLETEVPWWISPAEILRRPGITTEKAAQEIDIPEASRTFGTDVAKGIGQLASQAVTYILNPAIGTTALFAQGAEQGARRAEEKKATPEQKDVAVTMSAAVTGLSERMGLDLLLDRIPPNIKNRILQRITDIGIAGGIEAAQEAIEGIGHNMIAAAAYDPNAEIFEGIKEEASVAGVTGAVARAVINAILPGRGRLKGGEDATTEGGIPRDNRAQYSRVGEVRQAPAQAEHSDRPGEGEGIGSGYTSASEQEVQASQEAVTPSTAGATISDPVFGEVEVAAPETRPKLPEFFHAGSFTAKTTPIADENTSLYRETSTENLRDVLLANRDGDIVQVFVTDNPDLAIGQGANKGVTIEFYGDLVSGVEHKKPGTEIPGVGKEYKTDYLGKNSIKEITVTPDAKIKNSLVDILLKQQFTKEVQHDGSIVYTPKKVLPSAEEVTPPAIEPVGRREQTIPVAEERRTGDRRIENEVRAEVQDILDTAEKLGIPEEERRAMIEDSKITKLSKDMTAEERRQAMLTSAITGLPNKTAYIEDIISRENKSLTGALDVDSLKWVNDNMGHPAGDQLLAIVGRAIKEVIHETDVKGYHLSGDEFILQGDNKLVIDQAVEDINKALSEVEITVELPSGEIVTKKGFQLTHGVAPSPKRADFELAAEKIRKERAGLRAGRGEEPPGVVKKPPSGKQDKERKAPVQKIKKPVAGLPGTAKQVTPPQPGEVDLSKKFEFSKEATNARIREAQKGASDARGIIQRIKDGVDFVKHGFTRHYINIPNTPEWANQIEYLRQLENASEAAKENTVHYIRSVVGNMTKSEYDDFQVKVLLDDLMYEAKAGRDLPFGYAEAELTVDHANITARIEAQLKLKKAIEFRNQYIQDLGTKLVEKGILSEDHLHNPNYFRHQVLEYARVRNMAQGAAKKLRKPRPGYAKERTGSIKDINANYLESEFEYVHRALIDLKSAETIKKIKTSDDITAKVKQDARDENGKVLLASGKLTPDQETEYNRLVATGKKTKLDTFLKEHLGDKYKNWEKFVPETHRVWQEEKGNVFFMGKTIGEHSMDALIDLAAKNSANLGIPQSELTEVMSSIKEALVVGGRKPQMIIRNELADTLDNMRTTATRGLFDTALGKPMGYWKIWTLINPHHAFKYNINNMFSDMDAIIAGNPGVLKKLFPAMKEIYAISNGAKPSQDYVNALERNTFSSGFVVQEVADINRLAEFSHFKNPKITQVPAKAALKYWRFARGVTQFRENAFRYAAYLDYIEKLNSGKSIREIGYGATNPEMVDALSSKEDKAALLARDLIGDYGGISAFGQEIRKKIIPFYSWMEINFKRYMRLIDNAFKQGSTKGVKTLAIVGAGKTAWLGVRIWLLYGLINLWNHLFFGDEEEKLSVDDAQRLHLILGTNEKGEVISLPIAGAWADFLSNFGFEEALGIVRAADKGADKVSEILKAISKAPVNKVTGGLTPVLKVPVELASGQSFWPDVFNPRIIPDKAQYVMRTVSFENEFDWLTGRPSKGYIASLGDAFVNSRDPQEAAYNSIRKKAFEFKQNVLGYEGISNISTPKSELIKLYKQALKLDDKEAANRLRKEMYQMKITPSDMRKALEKAHPLASIQVKHRSEFLRSLSKKERESLQEAIQYYNQTYR